MFMLSILDTNLCLVCSRLCNDKRLAELRSGPTRRSRPTRRIVQKRITFDAFRFVFSQFHELVSSYTSFSLLFWLVFFTDFSFFFPSYCAMTNEEVVRLEGLVRLVELCKKRLGTRRNSFLRNLTSQTKSSIGTISLPCCFDCFLGYFFNVFLSIFSDCAMTNDWQKKLSDLKVSSDSSNCAKTNRRASEVMECWLHVLQQFEKLPPQSDLRNSKI